MQQLLTISSYFGFALTLAAFGFGVKIKERFKFAILNPIIISSTVIIVLLLVFNIDYELYDRGTDLISKLLTPATICYAVPLYRQIHILKKNFVAIFISTFCGVMTSLLCILGMSKFFSLNLSIYYSLLPKSITTAIGMVLSKQTGGVVAITIGAIMVTGLTGAVIAQRIYKWFRIKNPIAKGLALGTSAHAIGTTKAFEIGEVEGAVSGLAIVITGLMTVILLPLFT
ncbi:LrgB family protein [Clostridium sp. PL3]|uniref:LrgB family protein n=1 Tax=Clostridium thailandense TaxID=2794346 RepID=A0A949U388_9CLOT|nr:LrgB family protein [Clostridium thailandense]MBV7276640.1 LrgB family protein [Clostridium thailandense]